MMIRRRRRQKKKGWIHIFDIEQRDNYVKHSMNSQKIQRNDPNKNILFINNFKHIIFLLFVDGVKFTK